MKIILAVLLVLSVLAACKEKNPVAEYGDTMVNSYQKGKQAAVDGNLDAVQKALQAYHAANDKYPEKLEEIDPLLGGTNVDFSKYNYDPQNGTVTLNPN